MFRKRSVGVGSSANDYSRLFALIDAVSPADNPTNASSTRTAFGAVADWEEWMRFFAIQRAVGNWDSYGWERGKNDYLYRTAAGFVHMPWDIDYGLGLGRRPTSRCSTRNDPRVRAMFNTPDIVRAYWRAFADLVNGPFSNAYLDPFIDARASRADQQQRQHRPGGGGGHQDLHQRSPSVSPRPAGDGGRTLCSRRAAQFQYRPTTWSNSPAPRP